MKNVIRLLAKEVRRIRVLIELMEKHGDFLFYYHQKRTELKTLRRILAFLIKENIREKKKI